MAVYQLPLGGSSTRNVLSATLDQVILSFFVVSSVGRISVELTTGRKAVDSHSCSLIVDAFGQLGARFPLPVPLR
jgi:hypothetical protein